MDPHADLPRHYCGRSNTSRSQKLNICGAAAVLGWLSLGRWSNLYSGGFRVSGVDLDLRGSQRHDHVPYNGSQSALYEQRPPARIGGECYSFLTCYINE